MVDLELMKRVLECLPIESQLILVGDPNQLPPVGSGSYFGAFGWISTGAYPSSGAVRQTRGAMGSNEVEHPFNFYDIDLIAF